MRRNYLRNVAGHSCAVVLGLFLSAAPGGAQDRGKRAAPPESLAHSVRELQAQVRELQSALLQMRAEMAYYRSEIFQTRRELETVRAQLAVRHATLQAQTTSLEISSDDHGAPENSVAGSGAAEDQSNEQRLAKLEEDYQLVNAKVEEQHQTKVESASKYRVRLSGIALLNTFRNRGTVDNLDFPTLALSPGGLDSGGTFGASLRQSQLGLEVFGAQVGGAKTTAEVQIDFAGGFPNVVNGVAFGLVRLRTATLRLDWPHTSVVAGQDTLFFSPLSPTSLASLAVPALSYAGNLWGWVPQVHVERRVELPNDSSFTLQVGMLDPLTGEPPGTQFFRSPQTGERSRQPGYGARVAWTRGPVERRLTLGVGGYYSRQNWGFGRSIDGWAGMMDWSVPLGRRFSVTGKFYRGRAIGGLNSGFGRSIILSGPLAEPTTSVHGLNSAGGWAQLKFRATSTLEFNAAAGQENPWAQDLRRFPLRQTNTYPSAARNRASLVNFIYRPRSDLVFSLDYRRLRTFELGGNSRTADHINLIMGILF